MHWFEQLTGLNPDGGSGSFEVLFMVGGIIVLYCLFGLSQWFVRH